MPARRLMTAIGTVSEPPPVNGSDCLPIGELPPGVDPCGNVDPCGFALGTVVAVGLNGAVVVVDVVNVDTDSGLNEVVVVLRRLV
jgi:hypothetical protein